jgi:predicted amidohydrolase
MNVRLSQFVVQRELAANLARILDVLDESRPGEIVVAPEGALSGYEPKDSEYLNRMDGEASNEAILRVRDRVDSVGCRGLVGSATYAQGRWWNSVLWFDGSGHVQRYDKSELSGLDRRHFEPGPMAGDVFLADGVPIGVLACRELLFPGAWMRLKDRGVRVVFHVNNAVQPQDALWTHILIARAIELGVFVCSVNNASAPQQLPSMLVAPSGRILLQSDVQSEQVLACRMDLAEVIADLSTRTDY